LDDETVESKPFMKKMASARSSICIQPGSSQSSYAGLRPQKKKLSFMKKVSRCFNNCCCCCTLPGSEKAMIKGALADGRLDIQKLWKTDGGKKAIHELAEERKVPENCTILERIEGYKELVKSDLKSAVDEHNAILREYVLPGNLNISHSDVADLKLIDDNAIEENQAEAKEELEKKFRSLEVEIYNQLSLNFQNSPQHKKLKSKYKLDKAKKG
jgi:hypothetical protein